MYIYGIHVHILRINDLVWIVFGILDVLDAIWWWGGHAGLDPKDASERMIPIAVATAKCQGHVDSAKYWWLHKAEVQGEVEQRPASGDCSNQLLWIGRSTCPPPVPPDKIQHDLTYQVQGKRGAGEGAISGSSLDTASTLWSAFQDSIDKLLVMLEMCHLGSKDYWSQIRGE